MDSDLLQQCAPKPRRPNFLFVAGTDTGVGKTVVCGLLLDYCLRQGLLANYQKWVSTGGTTPADLADCLALCESQPPQIPLDLQVPYRYEYPASPHLAAELQNSPPPDPEILKHCSRELATSHDLLIVEGVGGLLVPLQRALLLADLVAEIKMPLLIVARSGLGTLNHTLLTIEAARQRNIDILGVVFSDADGDPDESIIRDNLRTIAETGKVRVFGRLGRFHAPAQGRENFTPTGKAILEALGFQVSPA